MSTLQELLGSPTLHLKALWCPDPKRNLRWSAVSEQIDPTVFLEGEELLLTTTAGNPKTREEWEAYVQRLIDRGVAALGFGVGVYYANVPKELLRAARKLNFNLIEVAAEESFVRISQTLGQMIEIAHHREEKQLTNLQKKLITCSAKPHPIATLIELLAKEIGGYVQLGRAGQKATYYFDYCGETDQKLVGKKLTDFWQQLPPTAQSYSDRAHHGELIAARCANIKTQHWWLIAVTAGTLPSWANTGLQMASLLIGSILTQRDQTKITTIRLLGKAYDLIKEGELETGCLINELAQPYSKPLFGKFRLIFVQAEPRMRDEIQNLLLEQDETIYPTPIFGNHSERLEILVSEGALPWIVAQIRNLASWQIKTTSNREEETSAVSYKIGISAAASLKNINHAAWQAERALNQTNMEHPLQFWEELPHRGLLHLLDQTGLIEFSEDFLYPLKNQPKLLEILQYFSVFNGNRQQIAQQLKINRNTVSHRLAKIENLLKIDLDDPGIRAGIWLALQSKPAHQGEVTFASFGKTENRSNLLN